MKKLETLQNDLFAPLNKDEISDLNKIKGGGSWTNQGSDYIGGGYYYDADEPYKSLDYSSRAKIA